MTTKNLPTKARFEPFSEADLIGRILQAAVAEDYEYREELFAFHEGNLEAMLHFPASSNHHHRYVGGYYDHLREVLVNVITLHPLVVKEPVFTLSSAIVAAYFHDVDKITHRYEFDAELPTQPQLDYAKGLGIKIDDYESKTSISKKIDLTLAKEPIDEKEIPRFKHRKERLQFDDSAIVAMVAARAEIFLDDEQLSAIALAHGGWSALIAYDKKIQMTPMASFLHACDLLSSHCQDGAGL
jgi:hypothetical protein